jgi:hypothetical protein
MSKTPLKGKITRASNILNDMKNTPVPDDALNESQFETANTLLNMERIHDQLENPENKKSRKEGGSKKRHKKQRKTKRRKQNRRKQ